MHTAIHSHHTFLGLYSRHLLQMREWIKRHLTSSPQIYYPAYEQLPHTYTQELAYFLDHAHPGGHAASDTAQIGSIVCLKNDHESWQFILVHPSEAAPKSHLVSVHSPIGQATIGCRSGDVIRYPTADGERAFVVAYIR